MELLADVRKKAGKILPVEVCELYVFSEESGNFSALSKKDTWLNMRFQSFLEEGIVDWVFEEKRSVIIEDLDYVAQDAVQEERNFVIVPLIYRGIKCGIFIIYTPKPKTEFTGSDIERLTEFGDKIAQNLNKNLNTV